MSPPTSTEPTLTGSTTSTLEQRLSSETYKTAQAGVGGGEAGTGAEDSAIGFGSGKVPADLPLTPLGDGEGEGEHVWPAMSRRRTWLLIVTLAFTMTLNIMQIQTVTISQQTIADDLDIPTSQIQWLASAYSLAFGALLLLFGRLADIFGHKIVFMGGMAWFLVWSIAIALSPNMISIFLFRAFQGAGAGAAIPSALGIIGSSFPPGRTKQYAFAIFSGGAPLGGSLGGVVGGLFAQYASWRDTYYLSAGLAALVMLAAYFTVPGALPRRAGEDRRVDWVGAVLVTGGLTLFTFALADGSGAPEGWRSAYIPVTFSVGVIMLAAFWFYEKHLEEQTDFPPLMKVSLWRKPKFAWVMLTGALGWSAFSSYMLFASEYYENYLGLSQILTVVRFLPSAITGLILNVVVGALADVVPAQILIALGGLGTALAPLLLAVQDVNRPYWVFGFPSMILTVFGADFIFATGIMYVSSVANSDEQALAGGTFNCITQVGTTFGLAIMTLIQTRLEQRATERLGLAYSPDVAGGVPKVAVLVGLRGAFWGMAGFAFAAMGVACLALGGIGRVGHRGPVQGEGAGDEEKGSERSEGKA